MKRFALTLLACGALWMFYGGVVFVCGGFLLLAFKKYLLFAAIAAAPAVVVGLLGAALSMSADEWPLSADVAPPAAPADRIH